MADDQISVLNQSDDFSYFDCGDEDLNDFIKNDALRNQKEQLTLTYVYKLYGEPAAFCSVVMDSVKTENITDLDAHGIPTIPSYKIARLAVDINHKNRGVGKVLLFHSIYHAKELSKELGCRLVLVDSKPDSRGFYEKYGFRPIEVFQSRKYPKYYLDLMSIDGTQ